MQNYSLQRLLYKRPHTTVYKVKSLIDNNNYIAKIQCSYREKYLYYYNNEINCLKLLKSHINIVRFKEAFEEKNFGYIIEEYCENGDLYNLSHTKDFTKYEVNNIIKQILTALVYCNANNVIMGDIKPGNILIGANNTYKLCDFGFSQISDCVYTGVYARAGTPLYMAPEVIKGDYGNICDMYSIGVMAHYLLTKKYPYFDSALKDIHTMLKANVNREHNILQKQLSEEAYDFILQCMAQPYQRLTLYKALEHPFIKIL